jgi:hypothetical protein
MVTSHELAIESIEFVNELLDLMNQFFADRISPEYLAENINFVKAFAQALYEHAGISRTRAIQLTHNKWSTKLVNSLYHRKPLALLLFNCNPGSKDSELALAYPEKPLRCDPDAIEKLQTHFSQVYHIKNNCIINKSITVCIGNYRPSPIITMSHVGFNPGIATDVAKKIIEDIDYKTILKFAECSRKFYLLSRSKVFFRFVYRGDLIGAKKILTAYPHFAKVREKFEDLSGRIFICTALQYAIWSGDKPLQKIIREHLPEHDINHQTAEMRDPNNIMVKMVGQHYNLNEVFLAMYHVRCGTSHDDDVDTNFGAYTNLARAQKRLPAWIIYLWGENGENTAWQNLATKSNPRMEFNINPKRDVRILRLWYGKKQTYEAYPLMPRRRIPKYAPVTRGKERYLRTFWNHMSFKNLFEDLTAIEKLMGYQALLLADLNFYPHFTETLAHLVKFSYCHKIGFDIIAPLIFNIIQELEHKGANSHYIREPGVVIKLIFLLMTQEIGISRYHSDLNPVSNNVNTAIAMANRLFESTHHHLLREEINNVDEKSVRIAKNSMMFFRTKTPRYYFKMYLLESSCPTYAPPSSQTIM